MKPITLSPEDCKMLEEMCKGLMKPYHLTEITNEGMLLFYKKISDGSWCPKREKLSIHWLELCLFRIAPHVFPHDEVTISQNTHGNPAIIITNLYKLYLKIYKPHDYAKEQRYRGVY
jgi:hypothetical protein